MAYVVTEPCIKCKHTDCVAHCPAFCFHEGRNFLVIDPAACINCGACLGVCPVDAIYPEDEVPPKWRGYTAINRIYARQWPLITLPKAALPEATEFAEVRGKLALLDVAPGTGDTA